MAGRNPDKVAKKRMELGIENIPHFEGPYDLVVDATPVSSDPNFLDNAIGFSGLLKDCKIVFCHNMPEKDSKKNYLEKYCKKHGIFFIPGKTMYVSQMIKQFLLYFEGLKKQDGTPMAITEKEITKTWEL
jgi:shikimate dehydrogenase